MLAKVVATVRATVSHSGQYALAGLLASMPVAFSPDMERGVSLAKLALLLPLMLLALASIVVPRADSRFESGENQPADLRIAKWLYVAMMVVMVVATINAADMWQAVLGMHQRNEGMLSWLACAGAYFAGRSIVRKGQSVEQWMDIVLVASVAPCVYAAIQGLGLNFYFNQDAIATRPDGSMGSPVYLAAYLGLLLPVGYARVWQEWHSARRLALLLSGIAILQLTVLIWTLTRGPILAGLVAGAIFGTVVAAQSNARRGLYLSIAALIAAGGAILLINLYPPLREWASQSRWLERLVLDFNVAKGGNAALASLSVAIRVAYWHAGTQAFLSAPPLQQLVGFGADSAWTALYPHLSPLVMQAGGFRQELVVDRVACDALELLLSFGALGWLAYVLFYGSVVYVGIRHLFGLSGMGWALRFASSSAAVAMMAAMAVWMTGLPAVVIPAFGAGIGLGWCLFIVVLAARRLVTGTVPPSDRGTTLQLGLICSLVAFWLAAHLSAPVATTRLLMFFVCACVGALALEAQRKCSTGQLLATGQSGGADNPAFATLATVAIGISLVVALASFFPLTGSGGGMPEKVGLRLLPIGITAFVAALLFFVRRQGELDGVGRRGNSGLPCALLLLLPALFLVLQRGFVVDASTVVRVGDLVVPVASGALLTALFALVAVLAAGSWRLADSSSPPIVSTRDVLRSVGCIVFLGIFLAGMFIGLWRLMAADVADFASRWPRWEAHKGLQDGFRTEAARLQPSDYAYVKRLYRVLLAEAESHLSTGGKGPGTALPLLKIAEPYLDDLSIRFPNDPWITRDRARWWTFIGVAEQRRGDLPAAQVALERALSLIEQAHRQFPAQPLILQDWVLLAIAQGRVSDAALILNRMESLVPNDPEPYQLRAEVAARFGDWGTVEATRSRARGALSREYFGAFEASVAKLQQPNAK